MKKIFKVFELKVITEVSFDIVYLVPALINGESQNGLYGGIHKINIIGRVDKKREVVL